MNYYKTTIQYIGTNYSGLQWQNGIKTIQSEFNNALSKIIDGKLTTVAASRTDAGVHAIEQIIKISSINPIDLSSFLREFNEVLPLQIRCLDIHTCEGLFRPSAEAESKEYRYFFTNSKQALIKDQQFIANISNELDVDLMRACTNLLIGTHDFINFCSKGSNVKSTIRTVSLCELSMVNPHEVFSDLKLFQMPKNIISCYQLRIESNGFLKQMIRHLVSALWMVGSGRLSISDFIELLNARPNLKQRWKVGPANGLFLYKINYRTKE